MKLTNKHMEVVFILGACAGLAAVAYCVALAFGVDPIAWFLEPW